MDRITRPAAYALALLLPSVVAVTTASAQTPARRYGFCYGLGGNPRVENFTRIFDMGPSGSQGTRTPEFLNALRQKYGGFITQENDCPMFATAAEADANRRQLMDDVRKTMGSTPIVEIDWIPQGATSSAPAPPANTANPQPPPAVPAPAAPAAGAKPRLDYLGRPIPTTAYWVCDSRLRKYLYSTAPFFAATDGPTQQDIYKTFVDHLHKQYNESGTTSCNKYTTQAEAQASIDRQSAQTPGNGYQFQKIDWTYKPGASAAAAATPAKPAMPPAVTPTPASATVAPKPAAPAPAKPAGAATQSAGFVICRSEWNTDNRSFYNPPVDGRGATDAEWQASFQAYLAGNYGFKGSNLGCGKYPTLEAAQKDYDEWVANARARPSVSGRPASIIITKWKY